jgi:glutathione S-transferase
VLTSPGQGASTHANTLHHPRFALRANGPYHGPGKAPGAPGWHHPRAARTADSPYYTINPSGRVPYLVRDDGVGLEESSVICRYLDHLDNNPEFDLPSGAPHWESLRLGALATSLMDGLAVWGRETRRPRTEQSPTIIRHEKDRAKRLSDHWETEIEHPLLRGKFNLVQITLICALGLETRYRDFEWRQGHPKLCDWFTHLAKRPSVARTIPDRAETGPG